MANNFKHKKIKNTGLLYELLIRQMTSDVLQGKNPASFKLLKKYFHKNSPLMEELSLYNSLLKCKEKNSDYTLKFIDATIQNRNLINEDSLQKSKYNLVKEIQNSFDKDIFLKTQIDNYKLYASIYNIFENKESDNPSLYLRNKLYVANYINSNNGDIVGEKQEFLENVDPELKSLTFKLLTEKFNSKWSSNLNENQKSILRHFIFNSVDNDNTKEFISEHVKSISNSIKAKLKNTQDTVLKIKLEEVLSLLPKISNSNFITESHYLSLIRYYELIKELN